MAVLPKEVSQWLSVDENAGEYDQAEALLTKLVETLGVALFNDDLNNEFPRAQHHMIRALASQYSEWLWARARSQEVGRKRAK